MGEAEKHLTGTKEMLCHVQFPKDILSQRLDQTHKLCVISGTFESGQHLRSVGMIAMTQTQNNSFQRSCVFYSPSTMEPDRKKYNILKKINKYIAH